MFSCEVVRGEAQPQVPVHVRALVLLGLHGVEELLELRHIDLSHLRLHPAVRQIREARVADHVARVARDHEAAGVPLIRGQGQLRREALRLHQRLVVDHDELALVRPAVPLQEDPRALVAQQPQLRAAVGGRAVVGHLQLAPARPVLRQEESEKSEVLVTMSVLDAKSCGAETVPELVTSPQTTLPVDTPPLVAVKVQSRLSQSSGPAQAVSVIVSVAPVTAPVAAKLAAVASPEAISVPVDTSPTVVKFPALAVLLMVRVLPVIPVAELSRPTLAAPLMLSELPDTAPVDVSVAPATVPVAVSAAQETAPEASTPVVNTSVQFTSLHSSWSQPTLPCAVSSSRVAEPVRASESASRSVTETESPSKALALICVLYRSSVPADCCTSPGMDPPKAPKCSFAIPPGGAAPDSLRGRAEEGAGDARLGAPSGRPGHAPASSCHSSSCCRLSAAPGRRPPERAAPSGPASTDPWQLA